MSTKKVGFWVVVASILSSVALIPIIIGIASKKKEEEKIGPDASYVVLVVEDANIAYAEDSMTLDLLSGTIKTNEQVDKIFVNVNNVGVQELDFTASAIVTDSKSYIAHRITPTECLLSTCFGFDTTLTVDMYVEYGGRSYKVDTQKIAVQSAWTDLY